MRIIEKTKSKKPSGSNIWAHERSTHRKKDGGGKDITARTHRNGSNVPSNDNQTFHVKTPKTCNNPETDHTSLPPEIHFDSGLFPDVPSDIEIFSSSDDDLEDDDQKKLKKKSVLHEVSIDEKGLLDGLVSVFTHKSPIASVRLQESLTEGEDPDLFIATKRVIVQYNTKNKAVAQKFKIGNDKQKKVEFQAMDVSNGTVAAGARDGKIYVWKDGEFCDELVRHKGAITSIRFDGLGNLFSGGNDQVLCYWNLKEMGFVDCLYGHTSVVFSIDTTGEEKSISVGGLDGTARLWKVEDESQLVFGPMNYSLDAVCVIDEFMFITGNSHGDLELWSIGARKPHYSINLLTKKKNEKGESTGQSYTTVDNTGITALVSLKETNMFAAGTGGGLVVIVKIENRSMNIIHTTQVDGIVASIDMCTDTSLMGMNTPHKLYIAVGVSSERPQGRWGRKMTTNHVLHNSCDIGINM